MMLMGILLLQILLQRPSETFSTGFAPQLKAAEQANKIHGGGWAEGVFAVLFKGQLGEQKHLLLENLEITAVFVIKE